MYPQVLHLSFDDFFCFDDNNRLIRPHNIIKDLEKYQAPIGIKQHMLYVYKHLVNIQANEAEVHYMKFAKLRLSFVCTMDVFLLRTMDGFLHACNCVKMCDYTTTL